MKKGNKAYKDPLNPHGLHVIPVVFINSKALIALDDFKQIYDEKLKALEKRKIEREQKLYITRSERNKSHD